MNEKSYEGLMLLDKSKKNSKKNPTKIDVEN